MATFATRLRRSIPFLAALFLAPACLTPVRQDGPRDRFPLDPREDVTGPFAPSLEDGWKALLDGEPERAIILFESALGETPRIAAETGLVEATILAGRPREALLLCEKALAAGEPTVALLVACGEARGLSEDLPGGYALYRRALARVGDRPGLAERAAELRARARDALLASASSRAQEESWDAARAEILRALELAPESAAARVAAGEIEEAAGERNEAFRRYREALEIEPRNPPIQEKVGELALELNEFAIAVSVFDDLARTDPRYHARASEARLAFRVANWPSAEREAARSDRLTRAAAASLVWWMFPEVREARVSSGVIASDAVSRWDSRAVTRALALGLLEVDRGTHRANPDAPLTLAAASRLLIRLLIQIRPSAPHELSCLHPFPRARFSEAVAAAQACGLLLESEGAAVAGPAFTRALDTVRALASSEEAVAVDRREP